MNYYQKKVKRTAKWLNEYFGYSFYQARKFVRYQDKVNGYCKRC